MITMILMITMIISVTTVWKNHKNHGHHNHQGNYHGKFFQIFIAMFFAKVPLTPEGGTIAPRTSACDRRWDEKYRINFH